MAVNSDKPDRWKSDIARSVDFYNGWFMSFAPTAYLDTRVETTNRVESALDRTANLTKIEPDVLKENPSILPMLRMSTAPPIARDRLIGLAGVTPNLVKSMEVSERVPPRMNSSSVDADLLKVGELIVRLVDKEIFPWLSSGNLPSEDEVRRAATIVADRLCGAQTDPIIRNAQEQRQLGAVGQWLAERGYSFIEAGSEITLSNMKPGTFAFRVPTTGRRDDGVTVNVPVDTLVQPLDSESGDYPLIIEAKSAGDYANTNKRRKEEAQKLSQLRNNYGNAIRYILLLGGYFDSGYLGYEAAEGIDWIWEHRMDDLAEFGV